MRKEERSYTIKQALPEKGNPNIKINSDFNEWQALECDSTLISSILYSLGDRSDELIKFIKIISEK